MYLVVWNVDRRIVEHCISLAVLLDTGNSVKSGSVLHFDTESSNNCVKLYRGSMYFVHPQHHSKS
jgi:hypothetical protein